MRRSFLVITSLIIIASFGFGVTVVSVVGSSAQNDDVLAVVPINLANTEAVAGMQFSLKDVPNRFSVHSVIPAGRTSADTYADNDNSGDWTPGDVLITDHNVHETLSITDRAYLLFEGNILKAGTAEELAEDPEVRRLYLGNDFELKRRTFNIGG